MTVFFLLGSNGTKDLRAYQMRAKNPRIPSVKADLRLFWPAPPTISRIFADSKHFQGVFLWFSFLPRKIAGLSPLGLAELRQLPYSSFFFLQSSSCYHRLDSDRRIAGLGTNSVSPISCFSLFVCFSDHRQWWPPRGSGCCQDHLLTTGHY